MQLYFLEFVRKGGIFLIYFKQGIIFCISKYCLRENTLLQPFLFLHFEDLANSNDWCKEMETGYIHCYHLADRMLYTYSDALSHCEAEGRYLARIETQSQYNFVKNNLIKGMF